MPNDQATQGTQWDAVAAELRAYREAQKQTWGELDSTTIGRYLSDEVTGDEKSRVEAELEEHPELLKLTELVREVLNDFQPVETAPLPEPVVLPFEPRVARPAHKRVLFLARFRGRGALAAAACLFLVLGVALAPFAIDRSGDGRGRSDMDRAVANLRNMGLAADTHTTRFAPGNPQGDTLNQVISLVDRGELEQAETLLFQADGVKKVSERSENDTNGYINTVALACDKVVEREAFRDGITPYQQQQFFMKPVRLSLEGYGKNESPLLIRPASVPEGETARRTRVLEKSVPILTAGVRQDQKPELRKRCAETLTRIAPATSNAVPELTKALETATCPHEQKAVLEVLKNLGPDGRAATPALLRLAKDGKEEVREAARATLRSIRTPRWVGVNDHAKLFSDRVRGQIQERVAQLSKEHNFSFVAETVQTLPNSYRTAYFASEKVKQAEMAGTLARYRSEQVGANNGLYLLICSDPPLVQVHLGDEVRKEGVARLDTERVRKMLETELRAKDLHERDRVLMQVVQQVEAAVGK